MEGGEFLRCAAEQQGAAPPVCAAANALEREIVLPWHGGCGDRGGNRGGG